MKQIFSGILILYIALMNFYILNLNKNIKNLKNDKEILVLTNQDLNFELNKLSKTLQGQRELTKKTLLNQNTMAKSINAKKREVIKSDEDNKSIIYDTSNFILQRLQ